MTLSKQLYALILIISSLMALGTLYISIENTRAYLLLQLAAQTQNTADSLGLSLMPHMKNHDIAAMDTMVNAVFDGGYYKSITLKTMSGETIIKRTNTSQIKGVPQQFITALKLETPQVDAIIMSGWKQAGILSLEAHPGFAYKRMWEASMEILWWSLLVLALSFSIASLILRFILKPLNAVEKQALQICEREFPIVQDIPKTRELKRIVLAMNKMSAKVEGFINKLTERAEQTRKKAYDDELTGLINRKQFFAVAQHNISDTEQAGSGYIAIIRLNHFSEYNNTFGHIIGDNLLRKISALLTDICQNFHAPTIARISGVDFAVILPLADIHLAKQFGEALSKALFTINDEFSLNNSIHTGIAPFDDQSSVGEVLADADTALASAQHHGTQSYNIHKNKSEAMGNIAWKTFIQNTLQQKSIHFLMQPIMTTSGVALYHEVLLRVKSHAGQPVSPASFTAMAERMGQHLALDEYVIQYVLDTLKRHPEQTIPFAVNISAQSLTHTNFSFWLQQQMKENAGLTSKLYFEITEFGAIQDLKATQHFIDLVHQHKGKVIMEHFGTRADSFQSLRQLKVDYIKIDGSFVADISENQEQLTFVQSIIDVAHSLDIQVISERVETEHDVQHLQSLGMNAMQGYYFGQPKPISSAGH